MQDNILTGRISETRTHDIGKNEKVDGPRHGSTSCRLDGRGLRGPFCGPLSTRDLVWIIHYCATFRELYPYFIACVPRGLRPIRLTRYMALVFHLVGVDTKVTWWHT